MSNASDFIVENGVLKKYVGPGGDVIVPDGVTSIGLDAFRLCKTLGKVQLPESITWIGNFAFFGSSVTAINFPLGVEIGNAAFEGCASLEEIILPEGMDVLSAGAFTDCSGLKSIIFPHSLSTLENVVFNGCSKLKDLVLPENTVEIGVQCFDRCSALERIVLPESLKSIGGGAFARCTKLKQIECSDRVFRLFLDSCNAKNLMAATYDYLAGNLVTTAKPDEQFAKYVRKNILKFFPTILADDCAAAIETIVAISGDIDKKNLDSIVATAMAAQNAPSVTAWLLQYIAQHTDPVKVAAAEKEQIDKALGLKKMTVADWKNIYKIKSIDAEQVQLGQYSGTETTVVVPDLIGKKKVTVLSETFCGCNQLQEVQIPETVTEISRGSFRGCTQLSTVTLPKKLKTLGGGAFENCTSLADIELPKSASMLGMDAFANCTALSKVTLSPKIKKIERSTFADCTALTEIVIPEKCREIDAFAFHRCLNLKTVHIGVNAKSIDNKAFDNCPNVTIYAPAGSYAETYAKENNIPFVAE